MLPGPAPRRKLDALECKSEADTGGKARAALSSEKLALLKYLCDLFKCLDSAGAQLGRDNALNKDGQRCTSDNQCEVGGCMNGYRCGDMEV